MLDASHIPQRPLRAPSDVMRLSRMGAMFPTRLSFLRSLTRRLASEGAVLSRPVWNIDADGFGHAVYSIEYSGHTYSLVAISTDLPDDLRTDRVIATAWDSSYVLFDGVPSTEDVARIAENAPKQEAGRFSEKELVLSRANKSVRLFSHVVQALRNGRQPDEKSIRDVGYLMRTTAVYGNGKFGIADRALIADRPGLGAPFAAEMLTVWMIRNFTHDLVEHVGGAPLDRHLKRHLGIGNSTGLGMAPFLVSHPVLLNNWMAVRETALARVRAIEKLSAAQIDRLQALAVRATQHLSEWSVPDPEHNARIRALEIEFKTFCDAHLTSDCLRGQCPLDDIMQVANQHSPALQELTAALLIEPFGDLVDGLTECMGDPFGPLCRPFSDTQELRSSIETHFDWALQIDFEATENQRQFWYVSEEKLEPRLGDRFAEPGAELESPLDIGRQVQRLYRDLPSAAQPTGAFRAAYPHHEMAIGRVGMVSTYPYSEIRDNLIGHECLPIDMLRCKLSFFGASKFDPKSDRWTRITLCQGAPLPDELTPQKADDWWLPVFQS